MTHFIHILYFILELQNIYIDIQDKNKPDSENLPYYFAMTGSSFQVILQHFSNLLQKVIA